MKRGHPCRICSIRKVTDLFSGKYANAPVCKRCAGKTSEQQIESMLIRLIHSLPFHLSERNRIWLEQLMYDSREAVRSAAEWEWEIRFCPKGLSAEFECFPDETSDLPAEECLYDFPDALTEKSWASLLRTAEADDPAEDCFSHEPPELPLTDESCSEPPTMSGENRASLMAECPDPDPEEDFLWEEPSDLPDEDGFSSDPDDFSSDTEESGEWPEDSPAGLKKKRRKKKHRKKKRKTESDTSP